MFIIIGVLVILAVLGVGAWYAIKTYNDTITGLREENDDLRAQLEEAEIEMGMVVGVGPMQLNEEGEIIFNGFMDGQRIVSEDCLTYIEIPADVITEHMITDMSDVVGKITKIDLLPGAIFETTMLIDYDLKEDERELDVVLDEMPIGLVPGDYVDLRISFPLGQDYVVMVKKQVVAINSNTVKLIVNEEDVHHYESAKADKALYQATKLYTTKYVEFGLQPAASSYYPVTNEVLKTLILDPNINTDDWKNNLESRYQLEFQLSDSVKMVEENTDYPVYYAFVDSLDTETWDASKAQREGSKVNALAKEYCFIARPWPGDRVDKNGKVTSSRSELISTFEQARQSFEQLQAEKAREQRYYNY